MKKTVSLVLAGCLVAGLGAAPWLLRAADPAKAAPGDKPAADKPADKPAADKAGAPAEPGLSYRDPAFDKYVDMELLGRAWADMNPAQLTDAGLQLLEGERVLLRPHKGISAAKVLELAAKAAAEKGDKETLERLAKAADVHGDKELAEQVATARKLAGAGRAANPALAVSVEKTSPEDFTLYKSQLDRIRSARLAADRGALEAMDKEVSKLPTLTEEQRQLLGKEVNDALAALPRDAKADPTALALDKLAAATRGGGDDMRLTVFVMGYNFQPTPAGYRVVGYGLNGPPGNAFGDGSTLDPGDVIVQVGNRHAPFGGLKLDNLIQAAYNQGAPFVIVRSASDNNFYNLPLP